MSEGRRVYISTRRWLSWNHGHFSFMNNILLYCITDGAGTDARSIAEAQLHLQQLRICWDMCICSEGARCILRCISALVHYDCNSMTSAPRSLQEVLAASTRRVYTTNLITCGRVTHFIENLD